MRQLNRQQADTERVSAICRKSRKSLAQQGVPTLRDQKATPARNRKPVEEAKTQGLHWTA